MGTVRHLVAIAKGETYCLFRLLHLSYSAPIQAPPPEPLMMMMMDEDDEEEDGWYLFNDFAVRRISEDEALSFPGKWKVCTSWVGVVMTYSLTLSPGALRVVFGASGYGWVDQLLGASTTARSCNTGSENQHGSVSASKCICNWLFC